MPQSDPDAARRPVAEESLIFNVVVTGDSFSSLRYFIASLIGESRARFRLVINGCTDESIAQMRAFSDRHDRVVDPVVVEETSIVGHGKALDRLRTTHDDGEFFSFVDADIAAEGPWLGHFLPLLDDHEIVSSGKEVWTDDNVLPEVALGLGIGGRHFYHPNGFVYGCPHLAIYRRDALEDTQRRWDVLIGQRGDDLTDAMRDRLDEAGHLFKAYDTAKVLNILMQLDGYRIVHEENAQLVHIGGLSHFLAPMAAEFDDSGSNEPKWTRMPGLEARAEIARYTGAAMRALIDGHDAPPVPECTSPAIEAKAAFVRKRLITLMEHYGDW